MGQHAALGRWRALSARQWFGAPGTAQATALVTLGIVSTQLGSAAAKGLFGAVGPAGAVLLRVGFAALALLLLWRPSVRGLAGGVSLVALLFGISIAAMNFAFYAAIDRIPLGIAVTLEFVGPLGLAIVGSRRRRDVLWGLLAAAGILLLAPLPGGALDSLGVTLALLSGCCWAAYILLSARAGRLFPGGAGLALAMAVAAVLLFPIGASRGGGSLLDPALLARGAAVALLSSVIPYSLELEALRRLPSRVFGVLMSLEPAVAAVIGAVALHERLGPRAIVALLLVTAATIGVTRAAPAASSAPRPPEG